MMEIPLSIVAWMSVVLIQAIMHFGVIARRRNGRSQNEEMLENSLSSATADSSVAGLNGQDNSMRQHQRKESKELIPPFIISSGSEESNDSDEQADEPRDFMLLLSQTGTEMMRSCRSMESLVHEKVNETSLI